MSCAADPGLGVAVRLADYLDCSARTLGEQGFQAVAGQALGSGLLSGLVTIFVALIGYRMLLGHMPSLRDGVTWAVRLGVVLTLVTSWPAFQTVAYRAVVDGPTELAGVMLPAAGVPLEQLDARIQAAYDAMRLGIGGAPVEAAETAAGTAQQRATPPQAAFIQAPLPQTASLLVIATTGVIGAMRLAVGFLLAVAPLAFLGLLFDATSGLPGGWIRAVAGSALAGLAATAVAGLELAAIEGEIAARSVYGAGTAIADPQALTVIVLLFMVVMLVAVIAANRMIGTLLLPLLGRVNDRSEALADRSIFHSAGANGGTTVLAGATTSIPVSPSRAGGIADTLAATVRRERQMEEARFAHTANAAGDRRVGVLDAENSRGHAVAASRGGRRTMRRSSRSAARRDRVG